MFLINSFSNLYNRISNLYFRYFRSKIDYARHIGVKIGNNCFIATRGWSSEPYLIEIGDNVQLTAGVKIHTHGGGNIVRRDYPHFDVFGKVKIGDWSYIGTNAQIMPGVTIGNRSLVAAGAIVTKSIPDGVVVGGNPARYICTIEEYIRNNEKYNTNTKGLTPIQKQKIIVNLPDSKFIVKPILNITQKK